MKKGDLYIPEHLQTYSEEINYWALKESLRAKKKIFFLKMKYLRMVG